MIAPLREKVEVPSRFIKNFRKRHDEGIRAKTNSMDLGLECYSSGYNLSNQAFAKAVEEEIKETGLPFDVEEFRRALA